MGASPAAQTNEQRFEQLKSKKAQCGSPVAGWSGVETCAARVCVFGSDRSDRLVSKTSARCRGKRNVKVVKRKKKEKRKNVYMKAPVFALFGVFGAVRRCSHHPC